MIKADLARLVYHRHGGISYRDAKRIVEILLNRLKARLVGGENVKLTGFGSFNVVSRRRRLGRNPQTGQAIMLSSRSCVSFKPSKQLKFLVSSPGGRLPAADGPRAKSFLKAGGARGPSGH
ncbi:MAG: HU family DNA-binding protein [Acidobacteria bacterium]|nr:HU family DNA-binding protein [Acidobacteriota bacterium]